MPYYVAITTDDILVYYSQIIYLYLCLHFYKYYIRSYKYVICFSIQ